MDAPKGLSVTRTGGAESDLAIAWKSTKDVDHYTVTVKDGTRETSKTLPAETTSYVYKGSGACSRYRVRVTSVGKDGTIATTGETLVNALAPGGISNVTARRTEDGKTGTLGWNAPGLPSVGGVKGYRVSITQQSNKKVVQERVSGDTTEVIKNLDPARQYVAKVSAFNSYGQCSTGTIVLGTKNPSAPTTLVVQRSQASPATVDLKWRAPAWAGFGPITGYRVGYGTSRVEKWIDVKGNETSLKLDPSQSWIMQVRAVSSDDVSAPSAAVRISKAGALGTLENDPEVTITEEDGGVIRTEFKGAVGSSKAYPKMAVRIAPTLASSGFRDEQVISNGTATVVFDAVPCGFHTVTVTGYGGAESREFGRKVINRCDTGALAKADWKTVYGSAAISGNEVDMSAGSESRVLSLRHTGSADMAMQTDARLKSGWGYAVWVRANLANSGAGVTGYSIQYDPGYAKVNSFGKAFLLRQWTAGSECGTPLARVKMPDSISVYDTHKMTAVIKGDSLYMSIDGVRVFDVPSLKQARDTSGCKMAEPTGRDVGLRKWNAETGVSFRNTTVSSS